MIYVAITGWIGRQVLGSLGTTIASDPGDPILNAAILAWNSVHLPWTDAWFQFPIFDPTQNALTLSEHLLGISVIATPIYWMTGNALAAYNLTLLLLYPLSGLAMFLLVRRLTGSTPAAFLSGLAFAFAPYRASQLPHIQMLASFWAPLALLGLHRFVEAGPPSPLGSTRGALSEVERAVGPALHQASKTVRARPPGGAIAQPRVYWLALFAICWTLQGAANGYLLVYFTVLVGLWVLWFLAVRGRWREVGVVATAGAIALVPLVPILYRYLTAQHALGLSRNLGEIAAFGADIAAPLCAPPSLTFWGWLRVACAQEGELFAGATLLAICIAGMRRAGGGSGAGPARRALVGPPPPPPGARPAARPAARAQPPAPVRRLALRRPRARASPGPKPTSVALPLLLGAGRLASSVHCPGGRGCPA